MNVFMGFPLRVPFLYWSEKKESEHISNGTKMRNEMTNKMQMMSAIDGHRRIDECIDRN